MRQMAGQAAESRSLAGEWLRTSSAALIHSDLQPGTPFAVAGKRKLSNEQGGLTPLFPGRSNYVLQ
jgi:hypothetical protein